MCVPHRCRVDRCKVTGRCRLGPSRGASVHRPHTPSSCSAAHGRHRIDATTTARRCWSCTRSPVSRRRREPAKPAASQVRSDWCMRAKVPSAPWRPLAIRPRRARAAVCPLECRGDTPVKATGASGLRTRGLPASRSDGVLMHTGPRLGAGLGSAGRPPRRAHAGCGAAGALPIPPPRHRRHRCKPVSLHYKRPPRFPAR